MDQPENGLNLDPSLSFKAKAAKHGHVEEGEGNWLVSYADMMTLLVGFFVLLLSFSKIDSASFEKVKKETTKVFGGEYKVPFGEMSTKIQSEVSAKELSKEVAFQQTEQGIEINFRGALFFESGSAELKSEAAALLEKLIPIISEKGKEYSILIEGHTDNVPTNNAIFPSNWELSSVRACSVLRLFEAKGFPKDRLKAVGYGDTKPTFPNEDEAGNPIPENQAQNRRVVLKILKEYDS